MKIHFSYSTSKTREQKTRLETRIPSPKAVKTSYMKYNAKMTGRINIYIVIHYFIGLLGTAMFLFNQSNFPMMDMLIMVGFIIWPIIDIGGMFERRPWLFVSEILRMFALPVLVHHYFNTDPGWILLSIAEPIQYFQLFHY